MRAVRFFLVALAVFAGLGALYVAVFQWTWSQSLEPKDSLREVWVVKARLAAEAPSPRWLIVGGSSAWFGFDSAQLAAAVRQPVTNLGAHAELPLWFQLAQAEQAAQPGDTVLLAAELVHYWRARPTTYGVMKLGELAPEAFWQADWRRKIELAAAVPPSQVAARLMARLAGGGGWSRATADELLVNLRARWAGTYAGEVPGYYNYLELDPHGDFDRPRIRAEHELESYGLIAPHTPPDLVWRDIAGSARRLRERGVTCLFTWPPFEEQAGLDLHSGAAAANLAEIRERLAAAGWREAARVEDAVLAPEFFYDTSYHLTTAGAQRRTARLVERLREADLAP